MHATCIRNVLTHGVQIKIKANYSLCRSLTNIYNCSLDSRFTDSLHISWPIIWPIHWQLSWPVHFRNNVTISYILTDTLHGQVCMPYIIHCTLYIVQWCGAVMSDLGCGFVELCSVRRTLHVQYIRRTVYTVQCNTHYTLQRSPNSKPHHYVSSTTQLYH